MNKQQMVLNNLIPIGKKFARQADPSYHSFGQEYRAKDAQVQLNSCRLAYKHIRAGGNILKILEQLKKEARSESNHISLIIDAVKDNLTCYWAVNSKTLLIEFQEQAESFDKNYVNDFSYNSFKKS